MSVKDIESLFNPSESQDNMEYTKGDTENPHWTKVYRYPLGFLRNVGNVEASGVPYCFHKAIANVN